MAEHIDKADFERLTALAMADPGRAHMRPVIQKELLHYDILHSLDYVRNRDIWDLRWLKQQGGAELRPEWIVSKICDYRIDDYPQKLVRMQERLPEIIDGQVFQREISRFVPQDVVERTIRKLKFNKFLATEVSALLDRVKQEVIPDLPA